jgi:hypothetical protein
VEARHDGFEIMAIKCVEIALDELFFRSHKRNLFSGRAEAFPAAFCSSFLVVSSYQGLKRSNGAPLVLRMDACGPCVADHPLIELMVE